MAGDQRTWEAEMKTRTLIGLSAVLLLFGSAGFAAGAEKNNYTATILRSNEAEDNTVDDPDPLLVNSWGIAASPTGPWWVANNGTGMSTLYNGAGAKIALEVAITGASGLAAPTGEVFNGGSQFQLAAGAPARFMWASEDGTLSGWNPTVDPTHSVVIFNDPGSIYKGLAIHGDVLFTTDFSECKVEAFTGNPFDATFAELETSGEFEDDSIPSGYCPFGIQAVGDSIFVTYALKSGIDDVAGQGHGFVREFDTDGNLIAAVADHGQLNSPWGVAPAPSDFGRFSGCLLVGNFGDGRINAYCKDEEGEWHFGGQLRSGKSDVVIDGLWGIGFGNDHSSGMHNVLYFAAGPDDETNGYFGKVEVAP
jgi:uncharacterized protein (TIGR03118 family)